MTDHLAGADAGATSGNEEEASLQKRLAKAEERLGFYSSFDQVIQENISRASQLMREALELRERTQEELESTQANVMKLVTAERSRFQSELTYLHDELVRLQDTAAAMARRVASALGDLSVAEFFGSTLAPQSVEPGQSEAAVEDGSVESFEIAAEGSAAELDAEGVPAEDLFVAEEMVGTSELSLGELESEPIAADASAIEEAIPSYPSFDEAEDQGEDQVLGAAPAVGAFLGEAEEAVAAEAEEAAAIEAEQSAAEADEVSAAAEEVLEPEVEAEAPVEEADGIGAADDESASFDSAVESALLETETVEASSDEAVQEDTGAIEQAEIAAAAETVEAAEEYDSSDQASGGSPDAGFLDTAETAGETDRLAPSALEPRSVMVLVHGVPRAAAALSLQRHLHGLEYVDSVEAREYAEGILRLQVTANRELALDDLRSWDGGEELVPVTVKHDVIEVRLPGAQGF